MMHDFVMRRWLAMVMAAAVWLAFEHPAIAQEPIAMVPASFIEESPPEPWPDNFLQTALGVRTWISTGRSSISYAGVGGVPNVMSELHWRRLNNPVLEFSADTLWFDRLIMRADFGVGTAGTGRMRDQDFEGSGRTLLASETTHRADADNLYYFNLDLGWRVASWHGFRRHDAALAIDALIGWQYWSEKYVARGGTDLVPGDRVFPPGDVVASRFQWDSLRIGLRSLWQINEQWSLDSRVFFIPYTEFENTDIHYLRTDLLRDPTFIDRACGGLGVMADVTLAWRIRPNLGLEVGYRVWDIRSTDGISVTRTPTGDIVSPLNHAETIRHGVLLGMHWRF